jgi:hypothetical protein
VGLQSFYEWPILRTTSLVLRLYISPSPSTFPLAPAFLSIILFNAYGCGYIRSWIPTSGGTAQTFIDSIQEVHLHIPSLPKRGLTVFPLSGSFAFGLSPSTDQALDLPGLPPLLRRKYLSALCHICSRRALLPTSLQIPLCYNRLEFPQYRGGFADVWMGDHQGRRVAAKVLRVYTTSDFDKIRRVGYLHAV